MTCSNCQKEIIADSNFCYNCGARQAGVATGPVYASAPVVEKKLMRSSTDKKVAGVCAGVARYFDMDTTLVRVLWLLTIFIGGTGALLYVILWILLPVAPVAMLPHSAAVVS